MLQRMFRVVRTDFKAGQGHEDKHSAADGRIAGCAENVTGRTPAVVATVWGEPKAKAKQHDKGKGGRQSRRHKAVEEQEVVEDLGVDEQEYVSEDQSDDDMEE